MTASTLPVQDLLAEARERFDAARTGRDRHGALAGEILWLWSQGLGWSCVPLPHAQVPSGRPQAIRSIAKSIRATCIFLIVEATMRARRLDDDGTLAPAEPGSPETPALLGILCTPDGDVMFLSLIDGGSCADPQVRGDFVDEPLPPVGAMRGLMRPIAFDVTFN